MISLALFVSVHTAGSPVSSGSRRDLCVCYNDVFFYFSSSDEPLLSLLPPPLNSRLSRSRYEPPPFGPGTSLNRPSYGVVEAKPFFIQQLSRRPQGMLIAGSIATFMALAYIPISEFTASIADNNDITYL